MSTVDWSLSDFQNDAGESPGFMLWKVSTGWRRKIESALAPLGLTHPQFVILVSIAWLSRGEPVTQTAIGAHMNGDPNTVSQILKVLESRGLLTRKALDGRTKGVELTPSGTALFHQALPVVESADRDFFRPLGADTKALATLLGRLAKFKWRTTRNSSAFSGLLKRACLLLLCVTKFTRRISCHLPCTQSASNNMAPRINLSPKP